MTIILGTTSAAPGNQLYLNRPRGFDSVYACRVANNSASTVAVLTNMLIAGQSSEYLLCGQQNVYKLADVSTRPTAQAMGGGTTDVSILIEWSDDPDCDFLGRYPTNFTPTAG